MPRPIAHSMHNCFLLPYASPVRSKLARPFYCVYTFHSSPAKAMLIVPHSKFLHIEDVNHIRLGDASVLPLFQRSEPAHSFMTEAPISVQSISEFPAFWLRSPIVQFSFSILLSIRHDDDCYATPHQFHYPLSPISTLDLMILRFSFFFHFMQGHTFYFLFFSLSHSLSFMNSSSSSSSSSKNRLLVIADIPFALYIFVASFVSHSFIHFIYTHAHTIIRIYKKYINTRNCYHNSSVIHTYLCR